MQNKLDECVSFICSHLNTLGTEAKISLLNEIRAKLHAVSPFKAEPVDYIMWVKQDKIKANDYNPNAVAPPEMKLLAHSIKTDGYTQPVVAYPLNGDYEVVDGFHRHRVGREIAEVKTRVLNYLPIVVIKSSQTNKRDRMAATIRHNRARGQHAVDQMSEIVIELFRRNWTIDKISEELGMEQDEILRLRQIGGLAAAFADGEFSQAWEPADD